MADFNLAIGKIFTAEGYIEGKNMGYVNHPADRGGETIAGIARNFWKNEPLWNIVDSAKKQPNFPKSLLTNKQLAEMIRAFYKKNFWDKIGGDKIKSQNIAKELVDMAVNSGVSNGIKMAQRVVGLPQTGIANDLLIEKLNML